MKISHLNLNQFGVWSDLDLNGFSGGLNVLYGPRGAGKKTLVDFVRSMFYGFDPHTREQYIGADAPRSGGSLTVEGRYGRQTICRHDDGSRRGNFAIENEYGLPVESHRVQDMLSGIDEAIFDRVFAFSFRDRHRIDRLVDGAIATGFGLTSNHQNYGQRRELLATLNESRRRLSEIPHQDVSLETLQQRRAQIEADVEAHAGTGRRHGEIWTQDQPRWTEEVTAAERQLSALQDELHQVNQAISSCEERRRWSRTQTDHMPPQQASIPGDWYVALDDMEYQLQRWRDTLQDLETQRSRVQQQQFRSDLSEVPPAAELQTSPQHYLARIETEIRELQNAAAQPVRLGEADYFHRLGRVKWDATLQQMRHDVHRLCLELSRSASDRPHLSGNELERLRQCEVAMQTAIRRLMVRRREYLDKLQVEHAVDTTSLYRHHAYHFESLRSPTDSFESAQQRDWLEVADSEIKRLLHRRDSLQWHLNSIHSALNELREKSDELPWRHDDRYDRRVERNERELADIENQLRNARERRELTDRIATIEEQLRREGNERRSSTLEEASEILARITRNELRQIHLTAHRALWIEDAHGERVDYDRLGTGPRDQVYLSLCLALVNAYGRQNIKLPLVLNDICVNLDADWAEATIEFLHELGEQGQQIIALTGEERIVQLFRWRNMWVCELPRTARRRVANGSGIDFETVERYSAEPHQPVSTHGAFIHHDAEPYHFEEHLESSSPGQRSTHAQAGRQRRGQPHADSPNRLTATQYYDGTSSKFYVTELSPIEDTPSLDSRYAARMRAAGIQRIGDLLRIVPSDLAARLSHTEITANMIRVWQAETLLCCRVPNLRPYDARILVACGITDPDELSKIHPSGLLDRVEAFANTKHGRDIIHSGSAYELSRLTDWIRSARGARGKWSRWSRDWNGDGVVNDDDYGSILSGQQHRSDNHPNPSP
ncbi:MAG TPA: hypothetical protein DCY79_08190 [Planctomycetaceae bacterium]|nr:hypothetical protein [Planctomycetaceae bacterium]